MVGEVFEPTFRQFPGVQRSDAVLVQWVGNDERGLRVGEVIATSPQPLDHLETEEAGGKLLCTT